MVAPNDINMRIDEIHSLIMASNIQYAGKKLMDYVRDFSVDRDDLREAIVINSNLSRLEKDRRQQIIQSEESDQRWNKLLYQMLELIDNIKNCICQNNRLSA